MTDPKTKNAWWVEWLLAPAILLIGVAFPFKFLMELLGELFEGVRDATSKPANKDSAKPPETR